MHQNRERHGDRWFTDGEYWVEVSAQPKGVLIEVYHRNPDSRAIDTEWGLLNTYKYYHTQALMEGQDAREDRVVTETANDSPSQEGNAVAG